MKADALDRASCLLGSKAALARAVGVKPSVIQQWGKGIRPIPTSRCVAIEKVTNGAVSRKELRDDWREQWPKLGQAA